jgi:DNA-binding FadR family transcriptional regulator
MTALHPVKRSPLLHHTVQEAIRNYILGNSLQANDPLPPEAELARQLGVGRSSVREAVKSLESIGVLEIRRGMGIFVREFSFKPLLDNLQYGLLFDLDELAELLTIRRVLETGMIAQAMTTMPEYYIENLQQILEQMRVRAENGEPFPEEDRAFHQCLFDHLNNQTFLRLLDIFWLAFHKAVYNHALSIWDPSPMQTFLDHAAIVEAVQDGDVKTAQIALAQHYAGLEGRLACASS